MFESANLTHKVSKAEYKAAEPKLRERLIDAQLALLEAESAPVIVVFSGLDPLGRSAATRQLMSWMDARHIRPYAHVSGNVEEAERPRMWRFWQALPRRGRIGIFINSWYEYPFSDYLLGKIDHQRYREAVDEIVRFEEMLVNEGALLLKFMFVLPKKQTRKVIKDVVKGRVNAWKVARHEMQINKFFGENYDQGVSAIEELLSATSKGPHAAWIPLASADPRYRDLTLGGTLADAIFDKLAALPPEATNVVSLPALSESVGTNILSSLDLSQRLSRNEYRQRLKLEQRRLSSAVAHDQFGKRSLVVVFEGNDAAGKGGSIRRVIEALDPRMLRAISIAAPSDEERAQPYLWRFWRHVPQKGNVTIFDRSWYGRVLVERVESLCAAGDWMRAFEEIRSFEAELAAYGIIVIKFWLAIDKDEQLRRFEEREQTDYKRYKITDEDWRNRDKWDNYAQAVLDMIDRTSTSNAPWTLVEANDKYFARVKVVRTINERLAGELKLKKN
ncbi:MAG: polyphosphate:AMP phosphotransferase [Pseudomonadales bacterium]